MSAVAAAHVAGGFQLPFALFGISVSGILKTIAKLLFSVLAGALLPDWLRHAPADALRWLIALPDPATASQWPTMHRLEQDTTAVGVALLPLTFAVAVLRYTASGISGGVHHPAESIGRLVAAAAGLLVLPWAFANAVALVNVTTHALLSSHAVSEGLTRALALMFAGGVAFGVTGPVVALLVIGVILLAVGLFLIKVGLLALFAVLYVAGPLALAVSPVPELHGAWRAWLGVLTALALIPVGWCVIFAVAGALSADITHIGTPAAIGTRLVGFFAGVLTFFIAFRWPFFLIGMVRARGLLGGEMLGARGAASKGGSAGERVRQARQALSAGAGAIGQTVSQVGGALGLPRGGLAGAGARAAGRAGRTAAGTPLALRGRQGLASSWQAVRAKASQGGSTRSGPDTPVQAAARVAAAGPAAVRAAMAERGSPAAARAAAGRVLAEARSARPAPPAGANGGSGAGGSRVPAPGPAGPPAGRRATPASSGGSAARASVDAAAATAAAQRAARGGSPAPGVAGKQVPGPPAGPTPPGSQLTARPLETPPSSQPSARQDNRVAGPPQGQPQQPRKQPTRKPNRQRPQPSPPAAPKPKPSCLEPSPSKQPRPHQRQPNRKGMGR